MSTGTGVEDAFLLVLGLHEFHEDGQRVVSRLGHHVVAYVDLVRVVSGRDEERSSFDMGKLLEKEYPFGE